MVLSRSGTEQHLLQATDDRVPNRRDRRVSHCAAPHGDRDGSIRRAARPDLVKPARGLACGDERESGDERHSDSRCGQAEVEEYVRTLEPDSRLVPRRTAGRDCPSSSQGAFGFERPPQRSGCGNG